jgi:predicted dehydrogenase
VTPATRRDFLSTLTATAAVLPPLAAARPDDRVIPIKRETPIESKPVGPNDRVRIATIGTGIIGHIDTDTALKVPGVELVAAADVYEGRRTRVQEKYGDRVATTVDYREILARPDIDAVLICVPDHWHATMAIDAMKAGKAVYCEKPMVRTVAEGPSVIDAAAQTKAVFQVGSQYASSLVYDKARELIAAGAIGVLNAVEARMNRNSSIGAWQYSIPDDVTPRNLDWDRFLGSAPKRAFDAVRAFRWRNYWDYGTAVAGDLYVHLFTGIHHATKAIGPTRVAAMGGLRYWDDGRDVYDVIFGLFDYPKTDAHPAFNVSFQTNFVDGGGEDTYFRFVGSEGVITAGWNDLTVKRLGMETPSESAVLKGYNSVVTFSEAEQQAYATKFRAERQANPPVPLADAGTTRYTAPDGYDSRLDHFARFFDSVRNGTPVYENAVFGYRAAAPALLCNDSYRQGRILGWDPVAMKPKEESA